MVEERAASSIVGVILIVGVVVILAATVSVLALGLVEEEEPQPGAAFQWEEYNPNHGVLVWRHASGQNLNADRLLDKGGAVDQPHGDFEISAGQTNFVYARPGDTVSLVEGEGETRHVLTRHSVPDTKPLKPINWSASGPGSLGEFRSNFWRTIDGSELDWETRSDHLRVTTNASVDTFMQYTTTVPENSGNVTVEMRFEQESFQDSGYWVYLLDQSSDLHNVWCEESIPGGDSFSLGCSWGKSTINGTASKTLTSDEEFGAFTIILDVENPPSRDEVAKFYNVTVETN